MSQARQERGSLLVDRVLWAALLGGCGGAAGTPGSATSPSSDDQGGDPTGDDAGASTGTGPTGADPATGAMTTGAMTTGAMTTGATSTGEETTGGAGEQRLWVELVAGHNHNCALRKDGKMVCWGRETGATTFASDPSYEAEIFLPGTGAGWETTCAIWHDRLPRCFGEGFVEGPYEFGPVKKLVAAEIFGCAIRLDDTLGCFGVDWIEPPPPGEFVDLSAGKRHACALDPDGEMACWGEQEGSAHVLPGPLISVTSGWAFNCGLRPDHTLVCAGYNWDFPTPPPQGETYLAISSDHNHTCGILSDRTLTCWGRGNYGELEPPPGEYYLVDAGYRHACAVRMDDVIVCWGEDAYDKLTPP